VTEWGRDEVELVRRCREGSDAAYAVLVREHRPRLFTLACRLTGDPATAEDVVQEAFLAAFKAIDKFEPKPSLAPWLNTITVRIAKRAAARVRARPNASLDLLASEGDSPFAVALPIELHAAGDPAAAAEAAELRGELGAAIERLPFNYRTAVVLRFVMGLDYAGAAQTMGVPLNTFKSHLLRGTKLLREELARQLEATPTRAAPAPTPTAAPAPTRAASALAAAPPVELSGNGHGLGVGVELVRTPATAGQRAGGSGSPAEP
jgi:RNA polymerase sigma-70 factor (ECF subfamily)